MNDLIVIKFGGEIVENPSDLENLAFSVKELYSQGKKIILVHGGGPMATKISKKMGLIPKMVGGRRVTCQETLEIMKMTLPGIINSNILAFFKKHQLPAVAVSSISCVTAHKRPPKPVTGSDGEIIDFGFVGDIDEVDPTLFWCLLENSYIPVLSPLSSDDYGTMFNINGDTVAVNVAKYTKATQLVLVTKIGGVFSNINDPSSKINSLNSIQIKDLIDQGTIQGGMIPKLEESINLFNFHLKAFHIVGVNNPKSLLNELQTPGSIGTVIFKD